MQQDIRWKQRFENFKSTYKNLEPLEKIEIESLNDFERGGYIKFFELSFELLWKTIKDYLKENKVVLKFTFPKTIIQEAASFGLLQVIDIEGATLLDMLEDRNKLVHTYDAKGMGKILATIKNDYLNMFKKFKKCGDEN